MFGDLIQVMSSASDQDLAQRLQQRRKNLLELIKQQYPNKKGSVILFAPCEPEFYDFLQDSSFFYLSGLSEPSVTLEFGNDQKTILYMPDFGDIRAKWVHSLDVLNSETICLYGIDSLEKSGERVAAYQIDPFFAASDYSNVIEKLRLMISRKETIFTIYPLHSRMHASVRAVVDHLALFVPELKNHIIDISALIGKLRRKKDMFEIEQIYRAVEITGAAFQAASHVISPDASEAEVQAAIEYIFTENHARKAYSSIVASGMQATILHYHTNRLKLQSGELILIDAGAMYNHYCADITRVFPVSGKFNKLQKKLYDLVLDTQQHVVEKVRPGMWLSNPDQPDMSLLHIAQNYLKKYGYDQYFTHNIGHFLGLDVHDIGSRRDVLEAGDVITIEPGVYIPKESVGIRIEDNYWIVQDAAPVCLSEDIPKSVADIEKMVQQKF